MVILSPTSLHRAIDFLPLPLRRSKAKDNCLGYFFLSFDRYGIAGNANKWQRSHQRRKTKKHYEALLKSKSIKLYGAPEDSDTTNNMIDFEALTNGNLQHTLPVTS